MTSSACIRGPVHLDDLLTPNAGRAADFARVDDWRTPEMDARVNPAFALLASSISLAMMTASRVTARGRDSFSQTRSMSFTQA